VEGGHEEEGQDRQLDSEEETIADEGLAAEKGLTADKVWMADTGPAGDKEPAGDGMSRRVGFGRPPAGHQLMAAAALETRGEGLLTNHQQKQSRVR
jgi:hypothetical protein